MLQTPIFRVERVDGCRLGCLEVPLPQVADWLNFLATPHYEAELVAAEQARDRLSLYFEAGEGLYTYLELRLGNRAEIAA